MVALRLFSLLLAVGFALPAHALVFPYEAVGQGGRNNIVDSNGESCDNSLCPGCTTTIPAVQTGTGTWSGPGEGCYNRTGARCSATPDQMCDLQLIPKGRCTYGDLSATGGPGGTGSCVWPHGAGRCTGNTHVGCLTDAYVNNPAGSTASGPSSMCSGTPGGNNNCDMTLDPYGGAFRTACQCDGENAAAGNFETIVCGTGPTGTIKAVCSDGDPDRDTGGYGTALGVELNLGTGNVSFANMGPSMIGSSGSPSVSPPYALENIPSQDLLEPQRAPGSIGRGGTPTPIVRGRTTDAREFTDFLQFGNLGITKVRNYGNSYWADWGYASQATTGTFNTHIVVWPCETTSTFQPGIPVSGGLYCSEVGRDSISFLWSRDLTPAEQAANPTCPPTCKKDFDITTVQFEAFVAAGAADPDAGIQLALQSGAGPVAGAGDVMGVAAVTSNTWLIVGDMRCRMGGWGNADPNAVGRCLNGPAACVPGATGDAACLGLGQGNSCRACIGPVDAVTNPKGLPIGYNTHGLVELDLIAGQRIGGIAGVNSSVRVPLFVTGTTGFSATNFRDLPGSGAGTFDLADMGQVDPLSSFAVGVGSGGTFGTATPLPIGENCCTTVLNGPAGGSPYVWSPDALGTMAVSETQFNRTYDRGPGADGIPGCTNDNTAISNGNEACNQRLGKGDRQAVKDAFSAPGQDDVTIQYNVGGNGLIPASANRYGLRDASAEVVSYFTTQYGYASPNPKSWNTIASFPFRDIDVLGPQNADVLVKVNGSSCPLIGNTAKCTTVCALDADGDGVCDVGPGSVDNCPTVANGPAQAAVANVGNQTDTDADGVGDACDNCRTFSNARVASNFLSTNQWATLTGGQRDDDHDGYGNKCDAHFPGVAGAAVGPNDLAQFRTANNKARTLDVCGTTGTRPCAIFDLDELNTAIGPADLTQFRLLNNKVPGPRCPTCPLACTSGTAGTCGAIP